MSGVVEMRFLEYHMEKQGILNTRAKRTKNKQQGNSGLNR